MIIAKLSLTIALAISAEKAGVKCFSFLHEVAENDRRVELRHESANAILF